MNRLLAGIAGFLLMAPAIADDYDYARFAIGASESGWDDTAPSVATSGYADIELSYSPLDYLAIQVEQGGYDDSSSVGWTFSKDWERTIGVLLHHNLGTLIDFEVGIYQSHTQTIRNETNGGVGDKLGFEDSLKISIGASYSVSDRVRINSTAYNSMITKNEPGSFNKGYSADVTYFSGASKRHGWSLYYMHDDNDQLTGKYSNTASAGFKYGYTWK